MKQCQKMLSVSIALSVFGLSIAHASPSTCDNFDGDWICINVCKTKFAPTKIKQDGTALTVWNEGELADRTNGAKGAVVDGKVQVRWVHKDNGKSTNQDYTATPSDDCNTLTWSSTGSVWQRKK